MGSEADPRPVVMKFGGSSLATHDDMRAVAKFVVAGTGTRPVVVVVSAMGKTTNQLQRDAKALCEEPPARELDMLMTTGERHAMAMLALAITSAGRSAISLTGSQCGIITDHQHGRARIVEVRPFRILDELAAGHVVIVGGFQGVSYKREVTTLGRGGSDTTAVALAAALGADCEIYSDVDGVYSADPNLIAGAQRLDEIDSAEMLALSRAGARVLHARAVEIARERDIVLYARRTSDHGEGLQTVIRSSGAVPSGIRAITSEPVSRLNLEFPSEGEDVLIAPAVALCGLGLRYLQVSRVGASAWVPRARLPEIERAIAAARSSEPDAWRALGEVRFDSEFCAVTCVGSGLDERPELWGGVAECLGDAGIPVHAVRSDVNSVALLIAEHQGDDAARLLHDALVIQTPA
jgi:aspartate kinase